MTNTPTSPPSPGTSSPGERTQCFLMHEPTNSKLSATRRPGAPASTASVHDPAFRRKILTFCLKQYKNIVLKYNFVKF